MANDWVCDPFTVPRSSKREPIDGRLFRVSWCTGKSSEFADGSTPKKRGIGQPPLISSRTPRVAEPEQLKGRLLSSVDRGSGTGKSSAKCACHLYATSSELRRLSLHAVCLGSVFGTRARPLYLRPQSESLCLQSAVESRVHVLHELVRRLRRHRRKLARTSRHSPVFAWVSVSWVSVSRPLNVGRFPDRMGQDRVRGIAGFLCSGKFAFTGPNRRDVRSRALGR